MVSSISSSMTGSVDFAQMQKQLLSRADSDGDNRLSLSEFEAAKPKDAPADGPSSADIFNKLDANQDGYLTEQEMVDGAEQMGPPPGGPPSQALSEDGLKTLLDLLAQELDKQSTTTTSSDETDSTASATSATDETESASSASVDEEDKALALIQQFIDEYRSAQASYLSAQNLVSGVGGSLSTSS